MRAAVVLVGLLSCGGPGEVASAPAPAVTVDTTPPAPPPPAPVEEAPWSVAGVKPGEALARVVERAPFESPCLHEEGHRRFAAFGSLGCPFPDDTRVLLVARADASAPALHRIEAVAWVGAYLDERVRPPRRTGTPVDGGDVTVDLGETWRAVRAEDGMWRLAQGEVVRGHVVGEVPAEGSHPTWAAVRRHVLLARPPVPPCCLALRERAAVVPPHEKGAYLAGFGACMAIAGHPRPDEAMAAVRAILTGVETPPPCR